MHTDLLLLLARTTPAAPVQKRSDVLSVFLVDLRTAVGNGLEIRPIKALINHNTTEVFFDNLEVPAENLIGEEGKGFHYILEGMNAERILVASECSSDGRWLLRRASTMPTTDTSLVVPAVKTKASNSHSRASLLNARRPT